MHNGPKWSDTLSKSCSICCKIFKVCLTILGHYPLGCSKKFETMNARDNEIFFKVSYLFTPKEIKCDDI